ncbi:MAG: 4Fe-4S dicluster domain-containing protein [Armatimonadetes bacterium]|nr:4Fe-4S dicluster domain-containing protein [Armatimonadota bacterium]
MGQLFTETKEEICADILVHGAGVNPDFTSEVQDLSRERVAGCYQCGECTAGCPAAFAMDLTPNKVMRMVQLGCEGPVLSSSTIWLCAGCETCAARCPRELSVAKVMDACREIAMRKGIKPKEADVVTFHRQFLADVERNGRIFEAGMLARYKLLSGNLFNDIPLGMKMFSKGKLSLVPRKIRGLREIKKFFTKTTR